MEEKLKQNVHELVVLLEKAANIARENHEAAKQLLKEEALKKYENLSLTVCFDLLKASELDDEI